MGKSLPWQIKESEKIRVNLFFTRGDSLSMSTLTISSIIINVGTKTRIVRFSNLSPTTHPLERAKITEPFTKLSLKETYYDFRMRTLILIIIFIHCYEN